MNFGDALYEAKDRVATITLTGSHKIQKFEPCDGNLAGEHAKD